MILDIEKAYDLYSEITKDKYRYSNDISEYNEIVSIMDRMIDSVKAINTIKYYKDEFQFVAWINYADLLLATFNGLSVIYQYPLKQKNNFFTGYHKLSNKSDNDYFRFIRAIILPHALKLDDKKQKEFTKNMTARCPSLSWKNDKEIIIKYFIDDIDDQSHYITIKVEDIINYLQDLYDNINLIMPIIKKRKTTQKRKIIGLANNENYDKTWNEQQKVNYLIDLVKKYGTIEDKKGVSALISALGTAKEIVDFNFNKSNKSVIDEYSKYLNIGLDNLFDYIRNKSKNYDKLYEIVVPHFSYSYNYSEFQNCGYEINKIACEYKTFDEFIEKCYFNEWLKKLKPHLKNYIKISKKMSMKELCLLTIICFSLFKIKKCELKDLFGEVK